MIRRIMVLFVLVGLGTLSEIQWKYSSHLMVLLLRLLLASSSSSSSSTTSYLLASTTS